MRAILVAIGLLCLSNIFMTFAWYAHLKELLHKPWFIAVLVSWGIAFFEYLLQVPANRIGFAVLNVAQLKILQEVITLSVFIPFAIFYMKQPLKMPAYEDILKKAGVTDSAVAYIGDDLPDIPLLRRCGLAVAVGDAVPEVKKAAHYTTKAVAGRGAVREAIELILKSKGIWEEMLDKARA